LSLTNKKEKNKIVLDRCLNIYFFVGEAFD